MAVMTDGRLVVADNAVGCVSVIDDCGNETRLVGTKSSSPSHLHLINAVYCTPNNDVIVADHRLQVGTLPPHPTPPGPVYLDLHPIYSLFWKMWSPGSHVYVLT